MSCVTTRRESGTEGEGCKRGVTSSTHASAEAVKGWADATRHSHALVAASRHASTESEGRARINVLRGV